MSMTPRGWGAVFRGCSPLGERLRRRRVCGTGGDARSPRGDRAVVRLRLDLRARTAASRPSTSPSIAPRDRPRAVGRWGGACSGRVVVIRYLPARLDRGGAIAAATRLAVRVEILAPEVTP